MTPKQQYLRSLLAKFPETPTRTLAHKAAKEEPRLIKSFEVARSEIRRLRGSAGAKHRKYTGHAHPAPKKAFNLWESLPKPQEHFDSRWAAVEFPEAQKVLLLSDIHLPYHHHATEIALRYGKQRKPDLILLNGDVFDMYALSKFEPDPRKRNFRHELELYLEFLNFLRRAFPKARIVYKLGNHEERWHAYMKVKSPELLDIPAFSFEGVMRLDEYGIECVKDMRRIRLGKLNVVHGHEFKLRAITAPVNPARGFYMKAKCHTIGGHHHQSSQHSEKNLEDNVVSAWSTGCLCDLHPDFMPINNWNHGFAWVETDSAGAFHVENLRIVDGKVY